MGCILQEFTGNSVMMFVCMDAFPDIGICSISSKLGIPPMGLPRFPFSQLLLNVPFFGVNLRPFFRERKGSGFELGSRTPEARMLDQTTP
jgi:hypothetical protein